MKTLNQLSKNHTISEYKNRKHEIFTTVKVISSKGIEFEISKSENNVYEPMFYIGNSGMSRKSKNSVINYLLKN
jgi:hypothetical protein